MSNPPFIQLRGGHPQIGNRGAAPPGPQIRLGGAIPIPPPAPGQQNQRPPQQERPQQAAPAAAPAPEPRRQAVRVIGIHDLREDRASDAVAVYEELTSYAVVTLRKEPTPDDRKLSWERVQQVQEPPPKKDIARQIRHLDRKDIANNTTLSKKLSQLYPHQDRQVTNAVNKWVSEENDNQFTWELRQMDKSLTSKPRMGWGGKRQTKTITLYLQRAPRSDLDPKKVQENIEKARKKEEKEIKEREQKERTEREEAERRATQQQNPRPPQGQPIPGGAPFIPPPRPEELPQAPPRREGNRRESRNRRDRRRDRSQSTSDSSSSGSSYSGSSGSHSFSTTTESSSRDSRRPRQAHRSHRRHDQQYYIDDRPHMAFQPQPMLALPMAREPFLHDFIPRGRGRVMVHQRPMDDFLAAQIRREEEERRRVRDVRDFLELREAPRVRMERQRGFDGPRVQDGRRFRINGYGVF